MENNKWTCGFRADLSVEPHRPLIVTDGHFKVFFRYLDVAYAYADFQNAKEQ